MPTQQDVQRLIALREARKRGMMGPTQTAALQEIERRMSMGDQVASYVEPAMTAASAAFAEPVSGLVGLAALPFGADVSSRAIERTQDALTYQPRTEGGQQNLQGLMSFMAPVGEAFEGASSYLGDAAYEATGSPAAAAAAYSAPTAALELLGLNIARRLPTGKQYQMGDIGAKGPSASQRGSVSGFVQNDPTVNGQKLQDMDRGEAVDFLGGFLVNEVPYIQQRIQSILTKPQMGLADRRELASLQAKNSDLMEKAEYLAGKYGFESPDQAQREFLKRKGIDNKPRQQPEKPKPADSIKAALSRVDLEERAQEIRERVEDGGNLDSLLRQEAVGLNELYFMEAIDQIPNFIDNPSTGEINPFKQQIIDQYTDESINKIREMIDSPES